mmetsp:Transcript_71495/g.152786  ORF Transcript_71495/g.152786 Transcript_71495/m.152786 type:complete len:214 (-) Transcript_71495:118-759(-)
MVHGPCLVQWRNDCGIRSPLGKHGRGIYGELNDLHREIEGRRIFVRPPHEIEDLQVHDLPVEGKVVQLEDLISRNGEHGSARPMHCLVGCSLEIAPYSALFARNDQPWHADAWDPHVYFRPVLRVEGAECPMAFHPRAEFAILGVDASQPDHGAALHLFEVLHIVSIPHVVGRRRDAMIPFGDFFLIDGSDGARVRLICVVVPVLMHRHQTSV